MIVADTCIVTYLFNETEWTKTAQAVLKKDDFWILPPLWQEEYANVLSKLARQEQKKIDQVLQHFNYVVGDLQSGEIQIDIRDALKLSIKYQISVYDAHFITLAVNYRTVVVTEDKELLTKCPSLAISMSNFLLT